MITITRHHDRITTTKPKEYNIDFFTMQKIHYIASAYGFLIPRKATVTPAELAALIKKTYDPTTPRTAEIIKTLESL